MKINCIKHSYENFNLDIENISLNKGKIIGLIGENGSGKSTLMSILSGYLKASTIRNVDGIDINEILYIPSELQLYDYLTVEEFIFFIVKYSNTKMTIEEILDKLELKSKRSLLIEELSEGMRKKLSLVSIFTRKYELIILDEPFNSIDLNYIYKLKQYILSMKKDSIILISSHILDTLSDICDEFLLIDNGKIRKQIVNDKNIKSLESEIFGRCI